MILVVASMVDVSPAARAESADAEEASDLAARILAATEVQGGLIVHLGCGDGRLTAALCGGSGYLVQGLDGDPECIRNARVFLRDAGCYGQVSVDVWAGDRLPYIDQSVNLLVSEKPLTVDRQEVLRVLCPRGVAYVRDGGTWQKTVKPVPGEIDQWTHYLHDPSNNAVAHDTAVDFPRHLQWLGGPAWSRQHDHMSSSSAIVSAAGRNFYIFDEGSASSIQLPSRWQLIARDAFNGVVLWRRPIDEWHTRMWRLKSGPAQLPRRLVAIDDTVYATLGIDAPVTALDAATGETRQTYQATRGAEEILCQDGVLYTVINANPLKIAGIPTKEDHEFQKSPRRLVAVDAETGQVLWDQSLPWIVPLSLAVAGDRVLFSDGKRVFCLDCADGATVWQTPQLGDRTSVPSYYGANLVVQDDVVLFAGLDAASTTEYHTDNAQTMWAFDLATGEQLWTASHPQSGYRSPEDMLVIDSVVWTAPIFNSDDTGVFTGRDIHTGEVQGEFPPDVETHWFHHRCYRAKATDRYLLTSRTGIEFVDPQAEHWTCHHWVRGACLYGIMPANGLIYNSPHPCACYLEAKLFGFNALAPARRGDAAMPRIRETDRLQRGPAYPENAKAEVADAEVGSDWPTYRCDAQRSGSTKAKIAPQLQIDWTADLDGRLSSPVVSDGRLFVSEVDAHTLHALDAETGKLLWSFTTGGRIDSPPTCRAGRVLFGSADGRVYCLRAADGALAWSYLAAPSEQRLVAFGQVESVWPVHGTVLVRDGVAWFVAGRSRFLDGGLRLVRLDAETGEFLSETRLGESVGDSDENLQRRLKGLNMPVALPDILSADQDFVYMRSQRFDDRGQPLAIETPTGRIQDQQGEGAHLFSPTGFLDDAYWHRSYWVYGLRWASGAGGYYKAGRYAPSGNLLVFHDDTIYGFSRKPEYFKWTTPIERQLFACSKTPEVIRIRPAPKQKGFSATLPTDVKIGTQWTTDLPIQVQAMVLADRTLFVAGPPDVFDAEQTLKRFADPDVQQQLELQDAALNGANGSQLLAVSAADGRILSELSLDGLPVFDGMAAAAGRLYLSTRQGQLICLARAR
jgi:outer membrane protein assembly factor BamB